MSERSEVKEMVLKLKKIVGVETIKRVMPNGSNF
jgi:hypothetical protein